MTKNSKKNKVKIKNVIRFIAVSMMMTQLSISSSAFGADYNNPPQQGGDTTPPTRNGDGPGQHNGQPGQDKLGDHQPPADDNRPVFDLRHAEHEGSRSGEMAGRSIVLQDGSMQNIIYNAVLGFANVADSFSDQSLRMNRDNTYLNAAASMENSGRINGQADAQSLASSQARRDADLLVQNQIETALKNGVAPRYQKPNPILAPRVDFTNPSSTPSIDGLYRLLKSSSNISYINNFESYLMQLESQNEGGFGGGRGRDGHDGRDGRNSFEPSELYRLALDRNSLSQIARLDNDLLERRSQEFLREDDEIIREISRKDNRGVEIYKNAEEARRLYSRAFEQRLRDVVQSDWYSRVTNTLGPIQQQVQGTAQNLLAAIAPQEDSQLGAHDGYIASYSEIANSVFAQTYPSVFTSQYDTQTADLENFPHIMNISVDSTQSVPVTLDDVVFGAISAENMGGVDGTIGITIPKPITANSQYAIDGANTETKIINRYTLNSGTAPIKIAIRVANLTSADMNISVPINLTYQVGQNTVTDNQIISVRVRFEALLSKIASSLANGKMVSSLTSFLSNEWNSNDNIHEMAGKLKGSDANGMLIRRMTNLVNSLSPEAKAQFKTTVGKSVRAVYGDDPGKCTGFSWLSPKCHSKKDSFDAVSSELSKIGL